MDANCLTECDVLAISTLVTNEIAKCVDDIDTLTLLADLITAIGETLTLLVGQRERFRQNCMKKKPANASATSSSKEASQSS